MKRLVALAFLLSAIASGEAMADDSAPYILNKFGELVISPDFNYIIQVSRKFKFRLSASYFGGRTEQNCTAIIARTLFKEIENFSDRKSFRMLVLKVMRDTMLEDKFFPDLVVMCDNKDDSSVNWENMIRGIDGNSFSFKRSANNSIGIFYYALFPDGITFFIRLPPA